MLTVNLSGEAQNFIGHKTSGKEERKNDVTPVCLSGLVCNHRNEQSCNLNQSSVQKLLDQAFRMFKDKVLPILPSSFPLHSFPYSFSRITIV